jgi:hypothetical protein
MARRLHRGPLAECYFTFLLCALGGLRLPCSAVPVSFVGGVAIDSFEPLQNLFARALVSRSGQVVQ